MIIGSFPCDASAPLARNWAHRTPRMKVTLSTEPATNQAIYQIALPDEQGPASGGRSPSIGQGCNADREEVSADGPRAGEIEI